MVATFSFPLCFEAMGCRRERRVVCVGSDGEEMKMWRRGRRVCGERFSGVGMGGGRGGKVLRCRRSMFLRRMFLLMELHVSW